MIGLFKDPHKFGRVPDPPEPPEEDPEFQVGDWIECKDRGDLISTMHDLIMEGIETELHDTHNGKRGLWLEVIAVE